MACFFQDGLLQTRSSSLGMLMLLLSPEFWGAADVELLHSWAQDVVGWETRTQWGLECH